MINVVELCGGYCQGMHCKSNGFRGKGGYFSVNVSFFLFFLFWFSKEGIHASSSLSSNIGKDPRSKVSNLGTSVGPMSYGRNK